MNPRFVIRLVSLMTLCAGVAMLFTAGVSALFFTEDTARIRFAFAIPGAIVTACSVCVWFAAGNRSTNRPYPSAPSRRDGFGAVAIGWLLVALCGSLPYAFAGLGIPFVSALFESMSGFTTTGVTALTLPRESLPSALLFWASLSNWLGGMGVIVLIVAIVPFFGAGGAKMYQAEAPDSFRDRVAPRIASSAKLTWGVYALLTVALFALLRFVCGFAWLDSVCYAFGTISTGGFATRSDCVAGHDNIAAEIIIAVFMILGSLNFSFHILALRGKFSQYRKDTELRVFLAILLCAIAFGALNLHFANHANAASVSIRTHLRASFFAFTSAITTTGYSAADHTSWPPAIAVLATALMLIGGCGGSTTGGLKVMRLIVLFKIIGRQIRVFIYPQATVKIKIGGQAFEENAVSHIAAHFIVFTIFAAAATALMLVFTGDSKAAFTSVAATIGNGGFGISSDISSFPPHARVLLTACMLFGRLEFFTVLALFTRDAWRK